MNKRKTSSPEENCQRYTEGLPARGRMEWMDGRRVPAPAATWAQELTPDISINAALRGAAPCPQWALLVTP